MAHYALLDENNVVVKVIVGCDECDEVDWEKIYEQNSGLKCKRTSYNTHCGQHDFGGTPFRWNYASIGGTYDEERDVFIPPKPFNSWILNENTLTWEAPIPHPPETEVGEYYLNTETGETIRDCPVIWDEETLNWIKIDTTGQQLPPNWQRIDSGV